MASLSQRRGWETILDTEDTSSAGIDLQSLSKEHVSAALKEQLPWCNLISILQTRKLTGSRMEFSGFGDLIGVGSYFMVSRYQIAMELERIAYQDQDGVFLPVGTVVALKRIIPRIDQSTGEPELKDSKLLRALSLEVQALSIPTLRQHDNIVSLISVAWENRGVSAVWPTIVLEYCQHNLSEYQRISDEKLSITEKLKIAHGIAAGLAVIHSVHIVHGDIKSENILIKLQSPGEAIPKLADFGCSLLEVEGRETENVWIGGTNPWRAPECIENNGWIPRHQAAATDLYSFALLLWRLFHDDNDPFRYLTDNEATALDPKAKEELKCSFDFPQRVREDMCLVASRNSTVELTADIVCGLLQTDIVTRHAAMSAFQSGELPSVSNDIHGTRYPALSGWHKDLYRSAAGNPIIDIKTLSNSEILDESRKLGTATKGLIFEELRRLLDSLRNLMDVCPGCCSLTVFDKEPDQRPTDLGLEHYLSAARDEVAKHICTSGSATEVQRKIGGLFPQASIDYRMVLPLMTCFMEGFGVQADVDRAMDCVVGAAERGLSFFQHDLAPFLTSLQRPFPPGLPVRKWIMSSIVYGSLGTASDILARSDPQLLRIAKEARAYLFDGLHFLAPPMEIEVDATDEQKGYTLLHKAACSWYEPLEFIRSSCRSSTSATFMSLLFQRKKATIDVDARSADGSTPLLLACQAQRRSVIFELLRMGASASTATNVTTMTPLHWATLMDDPEDIIDALISRGADVNALSKHGLAGPAWLMGGFKTFVQTAFVQGTPLFWAVATGRFKAAQSLIKHGADVNLAPEKSLTPLEVAVYMCDKELVELLLSQSPEIGDAFWELTNDFTSMKHLIFHHTQGDRAVIAKMLSNFGPRASDSDVYDFFEVTIVRAVQGADLVLLEALLTCLDDCFSRNGNYRGNPLAYSSWDSHLLSHKAAGRNDPEILKLVLRMGAKVERSLHTLAEEGGSRQSECIAVLLDHGAQLDSRNRGAAGTSNGPFTPFGYAIFHGNIDAANIFRQHMTEDQLLAALGADLNILVGSGERETGTTLLGALIHYSSASISILPGLEYLCNLSPHLVATQFKAQQNRTALHMALDEFNLNEGHFEMFTNLPIIRFLVSRFNEPHYLNALDSFGYTPLHSAAWLAKFEECQLLVEAGATLNVMAEHDRTPLDCCFIFVPPKMIKKEEDDLGPTREMIRRFEEKRNACALYLRSKGARSGITEITQNTTWPAHLIHVPFPERHRVTVIRDHHGLQE